MTAPTFKKATDTDPGDSSQYGAPDVKYAFDVLDATHATDRIQATSIETTAGNVQTDINSKAPIASPTFTGTIAIPNITDLESAVAANTAKATYPSADSIKLSGIEAAATADQSDAEIKTAYENNSDTNEFSDAEQTKLAGIKQPTTYTIAAADATAKAQAAADFVCDGTADEVQINAAIALLPTTGNVNVAGVNEVTKPNQGGQILLTEGSFQIDAPIDFTGITNFTLKGQGPSTVIHNTNAAGTHAIQAINVAGTAPWAANKTADRCYLSDFLVQGVVGGGDGIHIDQVDYKHLHNIFAQSNGRHGIYLEASTGMDVPGANNTHISQVQCQFNGTNGINMLALHETHIENSSFEENNNVGIFGDAIVGLHLVNDNVEDHASGPGIKLVNASTCQFSDMVCQDAVEIEVASGNRVRLSNFGCDNLTITTAGAAGAELKMSNCTILGTFDAATRKFNASTCEFLDFGVVSVEFFSNIVASEITLRLGSTFSYDLQSSFGDCRFSKANGADYTFRATATNAMMTFTDSNVFQVQNIEFDVAASVSGVRLVLNGLNTRTTVLTINEIDNISITGGIFFGGGSMTIDDCDTTLTISGVDYQNFNTTINATSAADYSTIGNTIGGTSVFSNSSTGSNIANIVDADISSSAAIAISKLNITETPDGTKFLRDDDSWQTIAGGGDALVANPLSQFAATTSLQLKNTISDETGSGVLVFATSPTIATPAITGNMTTTGLIDGRDVATDGTKLDTIETSSKDDQTGAEIKTAYEAESNAYTDTKNTKLAGIATGAEVNPDLISQAEAEAGTATTERIFSALRVAQAIAALESGGGAGGLQTAILKTTETQTVVSSTVLVNDDTLVLAVSANTTYRINLIIIHVGAGTPDIKFGFTVPSGSTMQWNEVTETTMTDESGVVVSPGNSNKRRINLTGDVKVDSTAGNLQLQWAQNVSNATAVQVKIGSSMILTEVS